MPVKDVLDISDGCCDLWHFLMQ